MGPVDQGSGAAPGPRDPGPAATLQPDALVLRDPGLCREARGRYPELVLHAAAACGYHNSPGLRLAESLGYRRVVLAGPINLKDLALMRRQTTLPLEVVLPQPCPGYGHLCLLDEYLGAGCPACCHSGPVATGAGGRPPGRPGNAPRPRPVRGGGRAPGLGLLAEPSP